MKKLASAALLAGAISTAPEALAKDNNWEVGANVNIDGKAYVVAGYENGRAQLQAIANDNAGSLALKTKNSDKVSTLLHAGINTEDDLKTTQVGGRIDYNVTDSTTVSAYAKHTKTADKHLDTKKFDTTVKKTEKVDDLLQTTTSKYQTTIDTRFNGDALTSGGMVVQKNFENNTAAFVGVGGTYSQNTGKTSLDYQGGVVYTGDKGFNFGARAGTENNSNFTEVFANNTDKRRGISYGVYAGHDEMQGRNAGVRVTFTGKGDAKTISADRIHAFDAFATHNPEAYIPSHNGNIEQMAHTKLIDQYVTAVPAVNATNADAALESPEWVLTHNGEWDGDNKGQALYTPEKPTIDPNSIEVKKYEETTMQVDGKVVLDEYTEEENKLTNTKIPHTLPGVIFATGGENIVGWKLYFESILSDFETIRLMESGGAVEKNENGQYRIDFKPANLRYAYVDGEWYLGYFRLVTDVKQPDGSIKKQVKLVRAINDSWLDYQIQDDFIHEVEWEKIQ